MGWFSKKEINNTSSLDWLVLNSEEQLKQLLEDSNKEPIILFKHSTRCSISSMAKTRLEREWDIDNVKIYYLDLITYRNVSNAIESELNVVHQSPQIIVVKNGEAIYNASHSSISVENLKEAL